MNHKDHTTSIESASATAIEANSSQSQEARSDAPDDEYDGTTPLDNPAHEAIARFFAAPRQFRQFPSVAALAEHFGVSRMTVYRWAEAVDVALRIKWLLRQSMLLGDLIVCREWHAIVQAQVDAALAGDTRAAAFCLNRAWRQQTSILGEVTTEPAIRGADALTLWQEQTNETAQAEKLEAAEENPETEGKNPSE
jgi:hypothetical protein